SAPLCLSDKYSSTTSHHEDTKTQRRFTENGRRFFLVIGALAITVSTHAQTKITIDQNTGAAINPEFKFKSVPSPSRNDIATNARVLIVDGEADPNSYGVAALTDGLLPNSDDQPRRNFFVTAESGGARLLMDLGRTIEIALINSY